MPSPADAKEGIVDGRSTAVRARVCQHNDIPVPKGRLIVAHYVAIRPATRVELRKWWVNKEKINSSLPQAQAQPRQAGRSVLIKLSSPKQKAFFKSAPLHCAQAYGVRKKSPHDLPSTYALPHARRVPERDVLGYYQPSRFAALEHREFECVATRGVGFPSSVWTIVTLLWILAPRSRTIGELIVLCYAPQS